MAYTGQVIENPVSGEQIVFRKTAADTAGEYLEIELRLAADGKVPGMHVHPAQQERFEVLEGRMKFRMGLKTIEAGPGDVVTSPLFAECVNTVVAAELGGCERRRHGGQGDQSGDPR
jgi:quercetin dioxygenase-like cupin family protein